MGRWLVPYEVRAIRRLRREGWEVQQIAELFGISRASISATCNGHRYSTSPTTFPLNHTPSIPCPSSPFAEPCRRESKVRVQLR